MSNNNIVSILHNDYIKRYKTQITIFIVIIIFVIASIFAYKWFIQPTVENLNEDLSNDSKRTGESQLYFFHADWCPHCKRAKPEWDNIVKNYDNKHTIMGYKGAYRTVLCAAVDENEFRGY